MLNWVDETTGQMDPIVNNFFDAVGVIFSCSESLKECDFWRTSAYDKDNHLLYLQAHLTDDAASNTMVKVGFTQSKITAEWYPYVNIVENPMNFGYSGYQFVTIQQ